MRTPALAHFIAEQAFNAPFRQMPAVSTADMNSLLGKMELRLGEHTLVHLWRTGTVLPIATSVPTYRHRSRKRYLPFTFMDEYGSDATWSIDLGRHVRASDLLIKGMTEGQWLAAGRTGRHLWWHRFQTWEFDRLARILDPGVSLSQGFYGVEGGLRLAARAYEDMPESIAKWVNSEEKQEWQKVLALLLYAEPLVHLHYSQHIRRSGWTQDADDFFTWQNTEAARAPAILNQLDLTVEQAKQWHRQLYDSATLIDPISELRLLIRYCNDDVKTRLESTALRAEALYQSAEVIRRYLEAFHGERLAEETGSRISTPDSKFIEEMYGTGRLLDFDRKAFRRVIRRFGLDPQARATWMVEGNTEVGLVTRLAQLYGTSLQHSGISLLNFEGLGGLDSRRTRAILKRLQDEEVFVYVTVDRDAKAGEKHIRELQNYAKHDLLVGFDVWEPDLEDANFTRAELAQIASRMASDSEIDFTLTVEDLESEMVRRHPTPVGKVIEGLLARHGCFLWKTEAGGAYLAEWIANVPCPPERAIDGHRPIERAFRFMTRSQTSNYWYTYKDSYVGEDGKLRPRPTTDEQ